MDWQASYTYLCNATLVSKISQSGDTGDFFGDLTYNGPIVKL